MADEQITSNTANIPYLNMINVGSDQSAPSSGRAILYIKNGVAYVRLDTGDPVAIGGAVALAEGQLAIGDGSGELSALALGTEGDVVTADASGFATWAAAPAGLAFSGASLTKSATQSITHQQETAVTFDGEVYDTDSYHDNVTNNTRLTIPTTGKYLVTGSVRINNLADNKAVQVYLRVDGATPNPAPQVVMSNAGAINSALPCVAGVLSLTAGQYVELFVYHTDTTPRNADTSAQGTHVDITRVG